MPERIREEDVNGLGLTYSECGDAIEEVGRAIAELLSSIESIGSNSIENKIKNALDTGEIPADFHDIFQIHGVSISDLQDLLKSSDLSIKQALYSAYCVSFSNHTSEITCRSIDVKNIPSNKEIFNELRR